MYLICMLIIVLVNCSICLSNSHFIYKSKTDQFRGRHEMFNSRGIIPVPGDVPLLNRKVFHVRNVKIEEQPYMVSIKRNMSHYLTGSLISDSVVITVARPITGVPTYELSVVAGESYNDRGPTQNDVIIIAIHPHYDRLTLNNNIAMLLLHHKYMYSVFIKPLQFPTDERDKDETVNYNLRAFVSGWGRCDQTGQETCLPRSSKFYPNEFIDPLLKTSTFIFKKDNPYCVKGYVTERALTFNHDSMCQGVAREESPMAPCLAVPGAPMVINGKIVGILSWGLGCGYKGDLPLIYTNIYHHRSWIAVVQNILQTIPIEYVNALHEATNVYMFNQNYFSTIMAYGENALPSDELVFSKYDAGIVGAIPAKMYDMRDFIFGRKYHAEKKGYFYDVLSRARKSYQQIDMPYAGLDEHDLLFLQCLWILGNK